MERLILTYDAANPFAQKMIKALLASDTFPFEQTKRKSELRKSIDEARSGKYFEANDADDLIRKCLS